MEMITDINLLQLSQTLAGYTRSGRQTLTISEVCRNRSVFKMVFFCCVFLLSLLLVLLLLGSVADFQDRRS